MVETFKPGFHERRYVYSPDDGITLFLPFELNDSGIDEFLHARKGKRLDDLRNSHFGFFTPYSDLRQSKESFNCAQDVLDLAIKLKNMLENDSYDLSACPSFGCARILSEEITDHDGNTDILFFAGITVPPCEYRDYLLLNMKRDGDPEDGHEYYSNHIDGHFSCINLSTGEMKMYIYPERQSPKEAIKGIIDGLFSIHLSNIKTVSINGGEEHRRASEGITMLWWLVLDRLRYGRTGICEFCGRPFISKNERGSMRKFCSASCRQRASNARRANNPAR